MPLDPISGAVSATTSKAKRWNDMYRKLHMLFLNQEYTHKKVFERTVSELNARITLLETNLTAMGAANAAAINAAIVGHFHNAPQAPAGSIPTLPGTPTGSFGAPAPTPTKPVVVLHTEQIAHNSKLIAQGPAQAPLADTNSIAGTVSNFEVIADIGV